MSSKNAIKSPARRPEGGAGLNARSGVALLVTALETTLVANPVPRSVGERVYDDAVGDTGPYKDLRIASALDKKSADGRMIDESRPGPERDPSPRLDTLSYPDSDPRELSVLSPIELRTLLRSPKPTVLMLYGVAAVTADIE